jgi:hypothetical protein
MIGRIKVLLFVLLFSSLIWAQQGTGGGGQGTGGGGGGGLPAGLNYTAPTLTVSTAGTGNGQVCLSGNTSGVACLTAPAVAGTTSNALVSSNVITAPIQTGPSYLITGGNAGEGYGDDSTVWGPGSLVLWQATGSRAMAFNALNSVSIPAGMCFDWATSINANASTSLSFCRPAAALLQLGGGAANSTNGFFKNAQSIVVTGADVTCGTGGTLAPCTSLTTITGLSLTLPLFSTTWSFACDLVVSQATAAAANQIGVQTATNGATNTTAGAEAFTAAAVVAANAITDVASTTTAQSVLTFTPGAAGTKVPIHLHGTLEGVSASGTIFNVTILTGVAADLLTIFRGSACWVY